MLFSTDQHVQVNIGAAQIENSSGKNLLGVTIDAKLSFEKYIEQIYAKTKAKLKALAKIASFMKTQKRKSWQKHFLQLSLATTQ